MKPKVKDVLKKLKRARERQGLSQQQVADKVGITREHLAKLEGAHYDPAFGTVLKLAKALKVSVAELVE